MRGAAPAAALTQLWGQLEEQFGAFTGVGDVAVKDAAPFVNATVTTSFANATVPLVVTVDAEGLVAGLHLGEPGPAASPPGGSAPRPRAPSPTPGGSPAAYVKPDAFTETEVTVGSAPWTLPGTLSMPKGNGPFPAVVLVAGSGPQDRDGTIGPNAPLRDLAWGLASNGIAVLRYDKRTKAHGTEMAAQVDDGHRARGGDRRRDRGRRAPPPDAGGRSRARLPGRAQPGRIPRPADHPPETNPGRAYAGSG